MRKVKNLNIRRGRQVRGYVPFTRSYSVRTAIIGLFLSAPFVIEMIILNHGYYNVTWFPTLEIIGLIVGGPMVLVGLVSFDGSSGGTSGTEINIQRIRYAAEQEMRKK